MDENPTLLRLKELETLEEVTEKDDKLTVFAETVRLKRLSEQPPHALRSKSSQRNL